MLVAASLLRESLAPRSPLLLPPKSLSAFRIFNIVISRNAVPRLGAMIDPLSIAGLTISIFDQLLKLGERTAQLIADAKTFDDVRRISYLGLFQYLEGFLIIARSRTNF
jgi:hypothetical protein